MSFTDAELRAYLNGDTTQSDAVETALTQDPAFEARLMALDSVAPMVAFAFAGVGENRNAATSGLPASAAQRPWIWPLLASACVGALILTAALWPRPQPDDWTMQVAAYQALYSSDTIAIVAPDPAALDQQFSHLQTAIGSAPDVDTLQSLPGLDLLRAQVLAHEGAPLGQIVFADAEGRPIALCYIAAQAGQQRSGTSTQNGLPGAHFVHAGFAYYLVGTPSEADAAELAEHLAGLL